MDNLPAFIDQLHFKIQNLIHLQEKLQQENTALKQQVSDLKQQLEEKKQVVKDLEEKNKVVRLANKINQNNSEEPSQDIKMKINELIREIDKCIANLNS